MKSPILFLARGHSGTSILAKILESNGVFMGDRKSLNPTYDSLPWTYDFQRKLLPMRWKYGEGYKADKQEAKVAASKCLARHMVGYIGGSWGIKTCAGMFSYPLWKEVFPGAKYIYLVRDGRDVILSGDGYFHMTNPASREKDWDYFKIITFGISNDINKCYFNIPDKPNKNDKVMKNRFWIQAKSWIEHKKMFNSINPILGDNVITIEYEKLCNDSEKTMKRLFDFLELPFNVSCKKFVTKNVYPHSVGRWKKHYIADRIKIHRLMGY